MEQFLLYLDELDDLVSSLGLLAESIRRFFLTLITVSAWLLVLVGGIALALVHPPLALGGVMLMSVTLLYRLVTGPLAGAHP